MTEKTLIQIMENVSLVSESIKYPLFNNQATFYVCKNYNCLPPTNEIEALN